MCINTAGAIHFKILSGVCHLQLPPNYGVMEQFVIFLKKLYAQHHFYSVIYVTYKRCDVNILLRFICITA